MPDEPNRALTYSCVSLLLSRPGHAVESEGSLPWSYDTETESSQYHLRHIILMPFLFVGASGGLLP
jgi:hypothetical protein